MVAIVRAARPCQDLPGVRIEGDERAVVDIVVLPQLGDVGGDGGLGLALQVEIEGGRSPAGRRVRERRGRSEPQAETRHRAQSAGRGCPARSRQGRSGSASAWPQLGGGDIAVLAASVAAPRGGGPGGIGVGERVVEAGRAWDAGEQRALRPDRGWRPGGQSSPRAAASTP